MLPVSNGNTVMLYVFAPILYRAGGIYIVGLSICLDVPVYMHTCMPRWRHSQTGLLSALVSTVDAKSVHCNV